MDDDIQKDVAFIAKIQIVLRPLMQINMEEAEEKFHNILLQYKWNSIQSKMFFDAGLLTLKKIQEVEKYLTPEILEKLDTFNSSTFGSEKLAPSITETKPIPPFEIKEYRLIHKELGTILYSGSRIDTMKEFINWTDNIPINSLAIYEINYDENGNEILNTILN